METNESDTATLLPNEVIKFEFRKNKENYFIVKKWNTYKIWQCKNICIKYRCPQFHKTKSSGHKRSGGPQYNNIG